MMITEDKVVTMNYTLKDEEGNILDQSESGAPLEYIQGHQNIIPGLEKELSGLKPGDRKSVKVSPEEGYGTYNPDLKFTIAGDQFDGQSPETGAMVHLSSPNGQSFLAQVVDVQGSDVVLDANHPLAGKNLFFDVEITDVRDASSEELSHGHPHGPDGHHHH